MWGEEAEEWLLPNSITPQTNPMDKFQTLLLILLGLGVFVWRMIQKAREMADREVRERPTPPKVPGLPTTSFQELLEQMKSQNRQGNEGQPAPPVARPAQTTPAGRPLPREQAPVPRSLERTEVPARSLETIPPPARSLEAPARPARRADTLPRTSALPARDENRSRQPIRAAEEARQDARRRVQAMLRNPADLRAGFILSEILKPKYE
jgi:hypothetical protein